jgi:hypothetical protein
MIGKPTVAQRLFGSLQVGISKTRMMLDWSPPVSVDTALKKASADFIELKRKQ